MRVLRENRDSVMAMLEAFVYDPLISWRLLADGNNGDIPTVSKVNSEDDGNGVQHKSPVDKVREQVAAASLKTLGVLNGDYYVPEAPSDLSPKRSSSSLLDGSALRRSKSKDMTGTIVSPDDEPLQNNLNTR